MKTAIQIEDQTYNIDLTAAIDISIPLNFNGPQPNAFGAEPAGSKACEYGSLVGDTRRDGSVNFEQYTLIPHCNGTHTECVGHITNERISVRDCLKDVIVPAVLVSVDPESSADDLLITRKSIESAILSVPSAVAEGLSRRSENLSSREGQLQPPATAGGTDRVLIIRTKPNDDSKLTRRYDSENIPPYFTAGAMEFIVGCGFRHLLVDLPSIDRLFDDGKLANHRIFWNVERSSFEVKATTRMDATITELIYVPNEVEDGGYLLNLQIAPFASDAAPSRPILFKLQR